jgi:hypothetical protein
VEPGFSVTATTGPRPAYRAAAATVSADSPLADTATTRVRADGGGSSSLEASSATAVTPPARSRAATTPAA